MMFKSDDFLVESVVTPADVKATHDKATNDGKIGYICSGVQSEYFWNELTGKHDNISKIAGIEFEGRTYAPTVHFHDAMRKLSENSFKNDVEVEAVVENEIDALDEISIELISDKEPIYVDTPLEAVYDEYVAAKEEDVKEVNNDLLDENNDLKRRLEEVYEALNNANEKLARYSCALEAMFSAIRDDE